MRSAVGAMVLALVLTACAAPPDYGIELEEALIPMPDGVRLAADLYLPAGGKRGERFPVLLEYLPYRKTESRGKRYPLYSYFVKRGYVVARVDIRGTGNSEGKLVEYEYTDQEQEDGEAVIDWLSKQPFSNGSVGMFGISWGAFNSIHMAMRNPPALKAIVALMGTDDLYQDDVHFIDGVLHFDSYEIGQDVDNAVPGAPDYLVDERFFQDRFDTTPWISIYKRRQRDGPFWDRASLGERYESIRVPTFVIGGWYDGYRDSVPRMLERLRAPVKAIVGPWAHSWPNDGYPKPLMEWRREAVRWFDHWLKGRDTGVLEEPPLALYVRDWHPPGLDLEEAPGRWRFEDGWPLKRGKDRVLNARADSTLGAAPPSAESSHQLRYVPSVGIEAGGSVMWYGDFAPDQRPTDQMSLVYDSEPLREEVEILGFPRASLTASADAPLAHWFVRLSDVAPDGSVSLITGGAQNGGHLRSAKEPRPLTPGEVYSFDVQMHFTSWVFPKGHRIRLSVGNAQWPMFWPTPYAMTTKLHLGGDEPTRLVLPVVPSEPRPVPSFREPADDPELPGYGSIAAGTASGFSEFATVERDDHGGARVVLKNESAKRYPWGVVEYAERTTHATNDLNPAESSVVGEYTIAVRLPDRTLEFKGVVDFRSDLENFHLVYTRRLRRDGELVREKTWRETFPRDSQ